MSTAILETPPTTAAEASADLPDLSGAFADAMTQLEAKEAGSTSPVKEQVKEKEGTAPETKGEKPAESVVVKKPKSALDAALSDDASTEVVAVQEPDEIKLYDKEPTKENWIQSRENFRKVSAEMKALQAKLVKPELPADVTAQLTAAKEYKAQLEKATAENTKLRDSIIALDVRYDPVVQEKIQLRDSKTSKLAADIKEAGADASTFEEIMAMPLGKRGRHLDALLESVESPRTRGTIERKLAEIEEMDEQLDEQISKPHKSFDELKQQREVQAREHADQVERFKTATFENVRRDLPKLSKLMRPAPADTEGAKEYNEALQADLAKAPSLLDEGVEPQQAVQAAYMAARYPTVEKLYVESRARISELEELVAKYEGSEPGFRGNGKQPPKADYEKPLADAWQEAMDAQRGV